MSPSILSTQNLCKTFGALRATDDVSIDLKQGEIHAIIGPNGAGKSTLIAQICGAMTSDSGQVFLDGADVTTSTVEDRAKRGLARTFQISQLAMEDTVLQNALLGAIGTISSPWRFWRPALKDPDLVDHAMNALGQVGLQQDAMTQTSALSHGQRRQLEVALALSLKPKAFIMKV